MFETFFCAKRPVVGALRIEILAPPLSLPPPPRCNYFSRGGYELRDASAAYGCFEHLICMRISKLEKRLAKNGIRRSHGHRFGSPFGHGLNNFFELFRFFDKKIVSRVAIAF